MGAVAFFVVWNAVRMGLHLVHAGAWLQAGPQHRPPTSPAASCRRSRTGSSIIGMFVMGVLIPRWTSINLANVVFSTSDMGAVAEKFPGITTLLDLINGGTEMTAEALTNGFSGLQSMLSSGYTAITNAAAYPDAPGAPDADDHAPERVRLPASGSHAACAHLPVHLPAPQEGEPDRHHLRACLPWALSARSSASSRRGPWRERHDQGDPGALNESVELCVRATSSFSPLFPQAGAAHAWRARS